MKVQNLLTVVALGLSVPAWAQTPATPGGTDESSALPALPPGSVASPGSFTPKVGGYIQARETYRDGPGLTAILNRARISVDGSLPQHFSYRVLVEYENPATTPAASATVSLRDAYIRWSYSNWSATLGQFKAPFSREYLMSITTLETPDRAALENLGPKRDIGFMAEYLLLPDLTISAGAFNGEGQNATFNRDSTVMFVGRVSARPIPQVTLGAATTVTGSDSTRLGLEAGFDFRGLALRGEFVKLTRDIGPHDEAWYGLATYRVMAGLSLVVREEALTRFMGSDGRATNDATTVGAFYDLPGGKMRAWLDYVHRTFQYPKATQNSIQAQLQVRF